MKENYIREIEEMQNMRKQELICRSIELCLGACPCMKFIDTNLQTITLSLGKDQIAMIEFCYHSSLCKSPFYPGKNVAVFQLFGLVQHQT